MWQHTANSWKHKFKEQKLGFCLLDCCSIAWLVLTADNYSWMETQMMGEKITQKQYCFSHKDSYYENNHFNWCNVIITSVCVKEASVLCLPGRFFDLAVLNHLLPWQPVMDSPTGRKVINYCEKIFCLCFCSRGNRAVAASECEPAGMSALFIIGCSNAFVFHLN